MISGGTVVLSIDAELIWGFYDRDNISMERIRRARESWVDVIGLLDKHRIPATWAVVGYLFLDRYDSIHSAHPVGDDVFSRGLTGDYAPGSEWVGQGLVDAVRDSIATHDIGLHSFSHVEFGKRNVSKEVVQAELQHGVDAASSYGVDPDSFVFPRNSIAYRRLLGDHGFVCYRGRSPGRWYDGTPIRPLGKLVSFALGTSGPPIVEPEVDEYGLVNVPASMYLFGFEESPRDVVEAVADDPIVTQVELGLERLTERDGILHLWFHPNDITADRDRRRLNRIFSMVAEYRDKGEVKVETMSRIANRVTASE